MSLFNESSFSSENKENIIGESGKKNDLEKLQQEFNRKFNEVIESLNIMGSVHQKNVEGKYEEVDRNYLIEKIDILLEELEKYKDGADFGPKILKGIVFSSEIKKIPELLRRDVKEILNLKIQLLLATK